MSHDDRDQRGGHMTRSRRWCDCTRCIDGRRRTRLYGRTRTQGRAMWRRDVADEIRRRTP